MKNYIIILLLIFTSLKSFGQTLFFDNLNTTIWTSKIINDDIEIGNKSKIEISKLRYTKDSLKQNVSIWIFRDSILSISNYDYISKSETLIGKFNIDSIYDQGILQIKFGKNLHSVYDIGINSSENFAILIRKKDKIVNFITTIDIKKATKDGIYLNGYVVNIPYEELKKLNGKKVLISGKVTIVKGVENDNDGIVRQGRNGNTKHILKPKINL